MTRTEVKTRLALRKALRDKIADAITALLDGGVKSYKIGNEELTKFDLPTLLDRLKELEDEIDELETLANGGRARKAYAVVPRDR